MIDASLFSDLQELSALLLALYEAHEAMGFADFLRETLRLVQTRLPFDSAVWAVGTYLPNGVPRISSAFLFDQPEEMLTSYERLKADDQVFRQALASPGVTVNFSAGSVCWGPGSEPVKQHLERYGMQQVLATLTSGPITELTCAICLYRADPAQPFSERERALQQAIVPHLVSLHNRSRIRFLAGLAHPGEMLRTRAAALVDVQGILHGCTPEFVGLMQTEWPQWRGPTVPRELASSDATQRRGLALRRIVCHATPISELLLLSLRDMAACDSLSDREWEVATAFAGGSSHKEVARRLGIAPGTVRNHLGAVYEKLGVDNKVELSSALQAVRGGSSDT